MRKQCFIWSSDKPDHQFSVHSPDFKLPKRQGRLSKKVWRQRIAELQEAKNDPELEKLARNRKCKWQWQFFYNINAQENSQNLQQNTSH